MKLVELEEKEFKKFADKHEQITFHQTINWGNLKKTNGWIPHYIGAFINKKIVAGALILEKSTEGEFDNVFVLLFITYLSLLSL